VREIWREKPSTIMLSVLSISESPMPDDYEFARKIMKREKKNPSAYTPNRKQAMIEEVHKKYGDKGLKEFVREFRKDLGAR
jgi:hypothetical protein